MGGGHRVIKPMSKETKENEVAIKTAATAAAIAAEAATTAANVAKDVASKAAETAANVAILSTKSAESVLLVVNDIAYIKSDISEIKKKMENSYVTQDQFAPVRIIAFGLAGSILLAVIGAIARSILVR